MEQFIIYLALILSGLCLGSFSGARVWRIRARQLVDEKNSDKKVNNDEYERLHGLVKPTLLKDRSKCLHCSYKLKWYDMIPVVSWLFIVGKCRKCRKPIGCMEPLIEIGMATFFVLSFMFWPYELVNFLDIARLVVWLAAGVPMAILFVYDAKWSLIDTLTNYILIVFGIISSIIVWLIAVDKINTLYGILGSVLILSGLYAVIYIFSKGKLIGGGDPMLALGLALLLADWRLAFVALFSANLIGCIIVIPQLITKKLNRKSPIPFGPLLITGSVIAALAGDWLINLYFYNLL